MLRKLLVFVISTLALSPCTRAQAQTETVTREQARAGFAAMLPFQPEISNDPAKQKVALCILDESLAEVFIGVTALDLATFQHRMAAALSADNPANQTKLRKCGVAPGGGLAPPATGASSSNPAQATPACKVLDPDIGALYQGGCTNGLAHGQGTARGRDTYVGPFDGGEPNGIGRYTWGPGTEWAGDVYVGDFKGGSRTGRGLYTYANGRIYEGDFVNGKYDGFGELQIPRVQLNGQDVGQLGTWYGDTFVLKGMFKDNKIILECDDMAECVANYLALTTQQSPSSQLATSPDASQRRAEDQAREAARKNCRAQQTICESNCASVEDKGRRKYCKFQCSRMCY
jgi:hypothetical protein